MIDKIRAWLFVSKIKSEITEAKGMGKVKDYILSRLKEASTWRGIILVITALGAKLSEDQAVAIITAGVAVAGLVGTFTSDGAAE